MFYSVKIFRTPSPGDSISGNPERIAPRKLREDLGYIEVLQQKAGSLNIKRSLSVKGNHISQVTEFSTFLCMGRYGSRLTEINSLMCTSPA